MIKKFINYLNRRTQAAEILRFVLVGGLATLIDFIVMGVVLYIFEPSLYSNFFVVFFGGKTPKITAALVGTGVGFTCGLATNYLFSIIFVFNEKGKSKSANGFFKFAIFSLVGLAIHEVGMYVLRELFGINEWIVKIILTIIVLVYNYLTRRLFIFKDVNDNIEQNELQGETNEKN